MYIIVTKIKEIAEVAKNMGENVLEVFETEENGLRLKRKDDLDQEVMIVKIMQTLAFKPNLKGYHYLKSILHKITVDIKYHEKSLTRIIYPEIAKEFNSTEKRVERSLRHSIEKVLTMIVKNIRKYLALIL